MEKNLKFMEYKRTLWASTLVPTTGIIARICKEEKL